MNARHGGSFIEVMVACVVLAVIALAGGSFVAQSQGTLAVHRNRCLALATANSRLEEVRATPFDQLTNLMSGTSTVWIRRNGMGWQVTTATGYDSFNIGTSQEQLGTGLILTNWPALGASRVLRVTTQATYRKPDYVVLNTFVFR